MVSISFTTMLVGYFSMQFSNDCTNKDTSWFVGQFLNTDTWKTRARFTGRSTIWHWPRKQHKWQALLLENSVFESFWVSISCFGFTTPANLRDGIESFFQGSWGSFEGQEQKQTCCQELGVRQIIISNNSNTISNEDFQSFAHLPDLFFDNHHTQLLLTIAFHKTFDPSHLTWTAPPLLSSPFYFALEYQASICAVRAADSKHLQVRHFGPGCWWGVCHPWK